MNGEMKIGTWVVQRELNLLSSGDRTVEIEPKVMEVLVYLAEHAGEVLSKSRIMRAIWPDTCVTPEVLTYSIFEIRRAFGDDARNPSFIQTIHRRGYRLIAPVTGIDCAAEGTNETAVLAQGTEMRNGVWTRWSRAHTVLTSAVLASVVAGIFLWPVLHITSSDARASVAVLPFENLGSDGKDDLFSSGLTEELIIEIGRMQPELRVITRVSAMQYQATRKSIGQIGRELKVRYILEGTVRHEGQRVRVSVQFARVRDQTSIWAESYDRQLGSALEIESEIARTVTNRIRVTLLANNEFSENAGDHRRRS